jgi:TolB-like protein
LVDAPADNKIGGDGSPSNCASREGIKAQLACIVASPAFDAPDRNRRFLQFVVTEALEGRAARLKAFVIATEVFGRPESFDAQNDPIVRMEAGRLRRALEHYYLTSGRDDPILISIPKGGYAPAFAVAPAKSSAPDAALPVSTRPVKRRWALAVVTAVLAILAAAWGSALLSPHRSAGLNLAEAPTPGPDTPMLLVEPIQDLTQTPASATIAAGLNGEIINELARFRELTVVVAPVQPAAQAPASSALRYALAGSLQIEDQTARLLVHLTDRNRGSVIWASSYEMSLEVRELLAVQAQLATAVATALAQPYGIVFSADAARPSPPDDWEAYRCTLAYYAYRRTLDPASHAEVKTCLQRAVDRFPDYATAWALLSLTLLDEERFRFRLRPDSPPDYARALAAAQRAVALDPTNVRGLQAEMLALAFSGQPDKAVKIGARAIAINPNDPELAADYGIRLAFSGDWTQGCPLIAAARERDSAPLGYHEVALALCAFMASDYSGAADWLRQADLQDNPIYHFVAAATYGELGATIEADRERAWITNNAQILLDNIQIELRYRINKPEDRAKFIVGLRKSGLEIEQSQDFLLPPHGRD